MANDLIKREDAIEALNKCDALMGIPSAHEDETKQNDQNTVCDRHCMQTEVGCMNPDCAWQ